MSRFLSRSGRFEPDLTGLWVNAFDMKIKEKRSTTVFPYYVSIISIS